MPVNDSGPGLPLLNGLVLAGGHSSRMGQDKSRIYFHGKEQRIYLAGLLQAFCREVFISCAAGMGEEAIEGYPVITDLYESNGPYGALLSAFGHDDRCAWLVLACDLPLLTAATLDMLVAKRLPGSIATAFSSPGDGLPEPLATIWEPASYPLLISGLKEGYRSPRKVLMNAQVPLLEPPQPAELMNVNTPEELEQAMRYLEERRAASEG